MYIQNKLPLNQLDLSDLSISQEIDNDNSKEKDKSSNNSEPVYLTNSRLNIYHAIYTTTITKEINQTYTKSKRAIDMQNLISYMNFSIDGLNIKTKISY